MAPGVIAAARKKKTQKNYKGGDAGDMYVGVAVGENIPCLHLNTADDLP